MAADVGGGLFPAAGDNDHRLRRGVMAVFHAGGFHHGVLVDLGGDGLVDDQIPQNGDQLLRGDPAGAQQPGAVFRQIHDGGLHAHPAWAAVHDGGDFPVMVMKDVLGGGGGGLSGNVGGGRGNGHSRKADDLPGHGIVRAADGHGGKSSGGAPGNTVPCGQYHGQRSRPEFLRQLIGRRRYVVAEQFDLLRAADVQNQGVVLWTTLGFKNFRHGSFVQTVCAQTVNRLRGDRHQLALTDQLCGNFRGLRVQSGQKKCFHQYTSNRNKGQRRAAANKSGCPSNAAKITRWAGWQPR